MLNTLASQVAQMLTSPAAASIQFVKWQNRRSTEADYLGIAEIRPESEPSHSRW
jgi:hypothetical protein